MAPVEAREDPWLQLRALPRGREVELRLSDGSRWRGTLLPGHELSSDRIVHLKLPSGYNVGLRISEGDQVTVLPPSAPNGNGAARPAPVASAAAPAAGGVSLLTTGGTIASRIDYRTGGVKPVEEEREILSFYPTLEKGGPIRIRRVFDRLSEEVGPGDWVTLAEAVGEEFRLGARGVVLAHGTDTLAHSAAALAFALTRLPGPVVLVGAQRSPDRPSSDGSSNLEAAVEVARSAALGEVVVLMHEGLSDDRFAVHRATRVRKMHSSRRDAFRSRNGPPIGTVDGSGVHLTPEARAPESPPVDVDARLDPHGQLCWFYPGLDPEAAERSVEESRGVILAGTGLGHVSSVHLPWIHRAVARGVFVGMTTQCLEGETDPYVYSTGRELLRAGVTYLGDLLPEVAYVKLLFALGRSRDPTEVHGLMLEPWAGEFAPRRAVGASE
jgi:glutamyl-tRNA(Gln) amidotransferase subunit D